jgi:hypothetical protein
MQVFPLRVRDANTPVEITVLLRARSGFVFEDLLDGEGEDFGNAEGEGEG